MTPDKYYRDATKRNIGIVSRAEQDVLRGARVGIVGMGGAGGIYLTTLVRMGIGRFHISDFDTFSVVNINRQAGAMSSTIGRPKAEVMAEIARDIHPGVTPDAGGGISKADWGGLCVYDPDKCGKNGPPKCKDCEKLDESGECPTCKPDPDKDGQLILVPPPLNSAASIEYAGKGWEQTLKRLKLPVEASIKFKGGFNALVERRCCSKSANGVGKKVTASGFGDVEVEGKINWAPQGFFLRLAQSALPGLTDLLDAGLYSKLKGALSIGGKASYFTCDQPPLDGEIAGAATLSFSAIDAEMKFPGVGDIKSVTFVVGEAGISGGWKWTLIDLSEAAIRLKRTGSAYLFFKSELKWTYRAEEGALLEPSRKLTFVQASLPLGGDGMDTLPFE